MRSYAKVSFSAPWQDPTFSGCKCVDKCSEKIAVDGLVIPPVYRGKMGESSKLKKIVLGRLPGAIYFLPTIIISESSFRSHCAKNLDGALRKPTCFV